MRIEVLDHGYVELVECWGHGAGAVPQVSEDDDYEVGIVEAARQSTQGTFRGWEQDGKLLRHLFNSEPQHATPFEFAGMVIEVQAPILVFREWHRHRTQSYNEMSARYAPLPDLHYEPEAGHVHERAIAATSNRQAQGSGREPTTGEVSDWLYHLAELYQHSEQVYQEGLRIGVPKEVARCAMLVSRYSRMRASANLRNWLGFLHLRLDRRAQWEIRQYADAVARIVMSEFPHVWNLFADKFVKDKPEGV